LKIAITADNHLTTRAKNPERFQVLEDIFKRCGERNIQLLIIAGDLFDQTLANYSEFEDLYRAHRPADLTTVVIPGNHDCNLHHSALAGDGLQVYAEPTLRPISDSRQLLFLPYQAELTMGEAIAPFADQLSSQRWILIGHGDWSSSMNTTDPYEPGVYMPLTASDLKRYQPELVFLGHIHLPQADQAVYYPGSPCPLNISETGLRSFITLDTVRGEINTLPVKSPLLYFDESFVMVPAENDLEILIREIEDRIKRWQLPEGWENQVKVRVKINGSARSDRQRILQTVNKQFESFTFYEGNGPDLSGLISSQDPERAAIARQIRVWITKMDWGENPDPPPKSLILEQALKIIYGHKS
jgi:DNA repair exonuclease SbcCD nuclease subunit